MTTEVAVLNKLAVALAADSASTIDTGKTRKIYNTANKIFDISDRQPLGLMIYGNADYMGLPFELLVKEFRRIKRGTSFSTVSDCMKAFRSYLASEIKYADTDEQMVVYGVLRILFRKLSRSVQAVVLPQWAKDMANVPAGAASPDLNTRINDYLTKHLTTLRTLPAHGAFPGTTSAGTLAVKYTAEIDAAAKSFYNSPGNPATLQLLKDIGAEELYREPLSDGRAGVVIAGFGESELCPSLCSIELDGIIDKHLKLKENPVISMTTGVGRGAEILAFAQDDIAEMFLTGIGPSDESYITTFVEKQLKNLASAAKQVLQAGGATGQVNQLDAQIAQLVSDFQKNLKERKEKSRSRIKEMVQFMPVQELVLLAESLIEITSLKRRVTDDLETVGGAVDVAAITRGEGLVWIKRKHYFDPSLNSRFFARQEQSYRAISTGGKGGKTKKKPAAGTS